MAVETRYKSEPNPGNAAHRVIHDRWIWAPGDDRQANTNGTFTFNSGKLELVPLALGADVLVKALAVNAVAVQFGKVVRLGVWAELPTGLPGELVFQTPDISFSVSGAKSYSCRLWLPRGAWFVGLTGDDSTLSVTALDRAELRRMGADDLTTEGGTHLRYDVGWTAGTDLTGYLDSPSVRTQNPPQIGLRVDNE